VGLYEVIVTRPVPTLAFVPSCEFSRNYTVRHVSNQLSPGPGKKPGRNSSVHTRKPYKAGKRGHHRKAPYADPAPISWYSPQPSHIRRARRSSPPPCTRAPGPRPKLSSAKLSSAGLSTSDARLSSARLSAPGPGLSTSGPGLAASGAGLSGPG